MRITVIAWLAANLAVVLLARGHLPFQHPLLHDTEYATQLLSPNLAMLEVLGLIAVTFALTRKRVIPDVAARAPSRRSPCGRPWRLWGTGSPALPAA